MIIILDTNHRPGMRYKCVVQDGVLEYSNRTRLCCYSCGGLRRAQYETRVTIDLITFTYTSHDIMIPSSNMQTCLWKKKTSSPRITSYDRKSNVLEGNNNNYKAMWTVCYPGASYALGELQHGNRLRYSLSHILSQSLQRSRVSLSSSS